MIILYISALFFACCSLLILLHCSLGLLAWLKIRLFPGDQFQKLILARPELRQVYPGMNDIEIARLLRETWSRPYIFEPYVGFKERAYHSRYVNVSPQGYRYINNQGAWPPQKDKFNIFFFGGSTTFGYGVSDADSIPSFLQQELRDAGGEKEACVYNFGQGFFFSTQERIFLQQFLLEGITPNLTIFFDGMNDFFCHDGMPHNMRGVREFFNGQMSWARVLLEIPYIRRSPFVRLLQKIDSRLSRNAVLPVNYDDPVTLQGVIRRYFENKKMIEVLANDYNFKTLFVIQPSPYYKCENHLFAPTEQSAHLYHRYGYPLFKEKINKGWGGDNLLWLADLQEAKEGPLYVDGFHYASVFHEDIAKRIRGVVIERRCMN